MAKYKAGHVFISTKTGRPLEAEVSEVRAITNAETGEVIEIKYIAEFSFLGQITVPFEFTEDEITEGIKEAAHE